MAEGFREGNDLTAGDFEAVKLLLPPGGGVLAEEAFDFGDEDVAVLVAELVGGKAGVGGEFGAGERFAEAEPEALVGGADDDGLVGSGKELVGDDVGLGNADAGGILPGVEGGGGEVGHGAEHAIEERDIDAATEPGMVAGVEGGKDGLSGEEGGEDVGDGEGNLDGVDTIGGGDVHAAGDGLEDDVVAGAARLGSGSSEGGDGGVDEAGIEGAEGVETEAEAVHDAGAEVFDDDVGAAGDGVDEGAGVGGFEVEGGGLFVAVHGEKIGRPVAEEGGTPGAGFVAGGGIFDFDDAGAEISQEHGAEGTGDGAGEVEHEETIEGSHSHIFPDILESLMVELIYDPATVDFTRPGKHHYQVAFHLDGTWGYSLVPLTVINGLRGDNENGVICFGGTHGNEYEGQIAVKRLCADLDANQLRGRVILMPQLSESACVANSRTSPLDGVNMNRAFPGKARGTISYRIAHFVKTRVFPQGRVVIDLHSGGKEGAFPICTSFHPIPDKAQQAETAQVARLFDPPFVLIYASTMASGLLTDEAEAEGKITVGSELGGGETTDREGVRTGYEGVLNVLKHYGLLEGEVRRIRAAEAPEPKLVRADQLHYYVPCPRDGVWEPVVERGAWVEEGQLLGRLHDFADHTSAPVEIRAKRQGWVAMMHLSARPVKGQTLYVVADEVDWREVL